MCVFLPTLSTDRFQKHSGEGSALGQRPLILVHHAGNRRVVSALNPAAYKLGLRVGMPVAKAQALVADLVIADASVQADLAALEKLALWALGIYSPVVAVDGLDGLVLDTTGVDHLHGSETEMANGIVEKLKHAGLAARTAVADTWGAAHALARFSRKSSVVVPPGLTADALLDLPIAALRLPFTTVDGLRSMGFETIGELASKPRAPLALRFGPELGRRLDQAFGRMAEPIEPIRPMEMIEVRRNFAEPIGAPETIAKYLARLVDELVAEFQKTGLGARRIDLVCYKVDNTISAARVALQQPNRDAKRLYRLLSDKIETIEPGFGIEIMSLAATIVEPLEIRQSHSSLVEEGVADVSDLVDTLANRVGRSRIFAVKPVASDVPERSFMRVPPLEEPINDLWRNDWPRPARLFDTPQPIEAIAMLPDCPPASFTWKGIRHRVKRADGPERIFGEWWRRDTELTAVRDYFQIENENGERFWIYRAGDGEHLETGSREWFLHGIFA